MTANNEYMTVLNMDRDLITTVSQEFVLQFYTIMNKHPGSLHRFYKEESTLIRDDLYAQGQQEIHKFYMNLELSNCKAVVLSLDAVRAHHKSILIQVTGEIANNGSDLRRFMQSFVLVEQDLGNFYVLNDIFRYQDQTFKAEDIEDAAIIEQEVHNEESHAEVNDFQSWNDVGRASETVQVDLQMQNSPIISEPEEQTEEYSVSYKNNVTEKEEEAESADHESLSEITQKIDDMAIKEKSWAAIISPMSQRPSKPTAPVAPQPQIIKPAPLQKPSTASNNGDGGYEKRQKPRFTNNSGNGGGGQTRPTGGQMNYPDEHQLFVGNLPQSMTEDDLRDFFSTSFGPVKDVRIQKSRSANDGKPLPNFGFLVFQSQEVVEHILNNKPIYYSSHRLNVEQKMGSSRSSHKPIRR